MSAVLLRTLADSALRISLLAGLVAALLGVLRVRSSTMRHGAWTTVLCAMLLMPLLTSVVPAIAISIPLPKTRGGGLALRAGVPAASLEIAAASGRGSARFSDEVSDASPPPNPGLIASQLPASSDETRAAHAAEVAAALYVAGVLVLSCHCWIGWRGAVRLARRAQAIDHLSDGMPAISAGGRTRIAESHDIIAPATVAVRAPTILLPAAWRSWPEAKLRAIVIHELTHITRRDPLIALAARINRCLFWFHPLAWWLPRTLTLHAEHACDAAALHAAGDRREYAQILIDTARTVRDGGSRVLWHGVGIDGPGLLGRRIERIISGSTCPEPSPARRVFFASTCAAVMFFVVACHPRSASVHLDADTAIEQRDHRLRQNLRLLRHGDGDLGLVDWETGGQKIETLESALSRNPEDLDTLKALLLACWTKPDAATRRTGHILRLIERHPDASLAGSVEARIFESDRHLYSVEDPFEHGPARPVWMPGAPEGYQQAKKLWLAHASRRTVRPIVLGNAAAFFESSDKPLAEQMLLRARALDPEGPWVARLGQFYATVLVGSRVPVAKNIIGVATLAEPRSLFGTVVRQRLAESNDDVLLTAAGWFLAGANREPWIGFDPLLWAESCLKRALQINPHAVLAHTELLKLRWQQTMNRGEPLWSAPPIRQYDAFAELPEEERFERLPGRARAALGALEDLARWDDPNLHDRRELARRQARQYAKDMLKLAPKYRSHPRIGVAIYVANMTLGALALRDGNRQSAVDFLRRASQAPVSEELTYADDLVSGMHWHLAGDLLKAGERPAVMRFLERMAEINLARRTALREAAAAISRGETPRL